MPGKVTLADVARHAGVSLSTASRAVNGDPRRFVRDDVLERVKDVALRLGYVTDATAQAVARGRTTTLGLVVADLADGPSVAEVYAGVAEVAETEGLATLMMSADRDADQLAKHVRALHRLRARGLVVDFTGSAAPVTEEVRRELESFAASGGVVCTVGRSVEGFAAVLPDERGGALTVATFVRAAGYRAPAVLALEEVTAGRRAALVEALDAVGRPVRDQLLIRLPGDLLAGRDALRDVLEGVPAPDVLIAMSTHDARCATLALDAGTRREAAVVGFTATVLPADVPPFTYFHAPLRGMGHAAAAIAIEARGEGARAKEIAIPYIPRFGDSERSNTSTS